MAEEARKQTVAERYRELLDTDPKTALELALAQTEATRMRFEESKQVEIDGNGRMVSKTLAGLKQIGQFYADAGDMLPEHFRGNPGKCAVAYQWASRLGVDTITLMQCSFVHKGKLGVEAKLLLGVLNSCGVLDGRIEYTTVRDGSGQIVSCQAKAKDKNSGQTLEGPIVTTEMVKAEGWNLDRGSMKSKWTTMPEVMYPWRAGAFFARLHYSDVVMGMMTREEMEDVAHSDSSVGASVANALLSSAPVAPPTAIETSAPKVEPPKTAPVAESPTAQELVEATIRRGQAEATSKPDSAAVAPVKEEVPFKTEEPAKTEDANAPPRIPDDAMKSIFAQIEKVGTPAGMKLKRKQYSEDGGIHPADLEQILDKCDAHLRVLDKKAGNGATQKTLV